MGTPTNRTPVRVARGSTTALNTGLSDIQEGEIVWDTTLNKLQVKEGSALEDHTVDTSTLAPLASPTFTGTVAIPNIANVETAITGKADLAGATFTDDITIIDDKKLKLGTGSDLELYHDGSNSFIHDGGTGGLFIRADNQIGFRDVANSNAAFADFTSGGSVDLYHNGAKKLETTSAGATVTGTVTTTAGVLGVGDALLANDQNWTGSQRGAVTALTDASTITVDFSSSNNYSVTLGGNRTLQNPINRVAGQSGSIFITQDGTGSRTLAYDNVWHFPGGTVPTLSTAANAVDRLDYIVQQNSSIHTVATLDVK